MIPADIIIQNGTVLTQDSCERTYKDGAVAVRGNIIVGVGPSDEFRSWNANTLIDAGGGIIMPGLVNSHVHVPMSLFRGLADDLPLLQWLNDHIFPAEAHHINPETVRIGALLSSAEMILSGTTTFCDGYFFEHEVAMAVKESGMRAVLGQGVIDFPAPGVPNPNENIRHASTFARTWLEGWPSITPSIFCHSPYTCSAETLKSAKAAADSMGVLFQIHACETRNEWDRINSEQGRTPIAYLDRLGLLDQNTLLAHVVWVDDYDIDILAEREAKVSHNPESNMKLASGIAPIPKMLNAGITVGIGTDGCASNNNLDLLQEMDTASKLHKVHALDPTVMDSSTLLKMATICGAQAVGLDDKIGSIEVGKEADIIVIDTERPHLVPMYDPVSHIIYAVNGSDVRDVMVAGRILLKDRKLLTLDVDKLLERVTLLEKSIKR